ncbi:MAG: DUF5119 domain-containing protein [Alistipes sp.]|nr:DUF5119 domain-containing protein [Alistipes sp.]
MKRIFTYVLSGALFFALAAEVGCVKQGLDNRKNEGSVEIALNWNGETPSGSRIHFYPVESAAEPVELEEGVDEAIPEYRVVDGSASGWKGKLPVGTYRVIVYNSDANVSLRNEQDYEHAELYVPLESEIAAAGVSPISRVGECICQPGNAMVASQLEEGLLKVPFNDFVKVTAAPKPVVKYVEFNFRVEGDVTLTGGMLTGVSQAVCCTTLKYHTDCYGVRFSVEPYSGEGDYNYEAKIAMLDLVAPGAGAAHSVVLNLAANGTPYSIAVNVTDQVAKYLAEQGGAIPVGEALPINIRLEMIGNVPSVEVLPWDNTGTGSGTIGNTTGGGSADVR